MRRGTYAATGHTAVGSTQALELAVRAHLSMLKTRRVVVFSNNGVDLLANVEFGDPCLWHFDLPSIAFRFSGWPENPCGPS